MGRSLSRSIRALATILTALTMALGFASPAAAEQAWDPTLPKLLSAGAPGDPVAVAQASLAFTQQAAHTTMDLGRKFLSGLGIGGGPAAGHVTVSPVRTAGMTPYLTRIIET